MHVTLSSGQFVPLSQGTARRKRKVVHRTATTDDKKLQSSLKKLAVNNIPGIEEVWSLRLLYPHGIRVLTWAAFDGTELG